MLPVARPCNLSLVDLTANELNVRAVSLTDVCGDSSGGLGASAAEVLGATSGAASHLIGKIGLAH